MIFAFLGILLGVIAGLKFSVGIPAELIKYSAVLILAIIDSLVGAGKAEVRGDVNEDKYDPLIFFTGLVSNIVFACLITFLGEHLGLDLYLAVTVVFTLRIFTNIGKIRRALLDRYMIRKKSNLIKIEIFKNLFYN
jgi:small basic protein